MVDYHFYGIFSILRKYYFQISFNFKVIFYVANITQNILTELINNSKAREWRHDSDKTQTDKPKWWTISLKHFLKQPVFLKHISETKTSPRFPLILSEHADVVWASWGI